MTPPTVLVATWGDGLYAVAEATRDHEMSGQSIRALAPDGRWPQVVEAARALRDEGFGIARAVGDDVKPH